MENSIKEDIKIVENYLANSAMNEIDSNFFKNSGWETVDLEIPKSMQHILSDYKRVLKENEELKETYKSEKKMKNEYVKLYQDLLLKENVIPVQKVKDKIEKLKINLVNMQGEELLIYESKIDVLQELLEGRK